MADVRNVDIGSVAIDDDGDDEICKLQLHNSDRLGLSATTTAGTAIVLVNGLREAANKTSTTPDTINGDILEETSKSPGSHRSPIDHHSHLIGRSRNEEDDSDLLRDNKVSSSEDMPSCDTEETGLEISSSVSISAANRSDLRPYGPSCSALLDANVLSLHACVQMKATSNVHDVSCANNIEDESKIISNDVVIVVEKLSIGVEDVSRNRLPNGILENVDEDFKEQELEEVEADENENEEDIDENLIVLKTDVSIENDEETEEVLSAGDVDPIDILQPFSDEVDSLGSVDPNNDTLESRDNCVDDVENGVVLKSDGEMEDFVDGPVVGVSSGCVSSRSSNSSGGDIEIEDLVVSEEGDQSPKSSKTKSAIKRKHFEDSKNHCIAKKHYFSNSLEGTKQSEETSDVDLTIPLPTALAQIHVLKKRIPTKENPPPELAQWLDTFQCWSNAERLLALDQMIDLCDPTQVRHVMSVIEPQFQRDFISLLPKELALYVLSFLEPKDLLRAAQTCKYWRILAEDNLLWREKCREAGIDEVRDMQQRRRSKSCCVAPSPWKAAYMRQHDIEMNWRFRPIRSPKVLKGHDDHVITCLQFSGSRIVSGSDDNTLKVWSATTGKCLKTLVGHTGGVWSSQMSGSIIVSGSTDRTLKVWNADSGQCIHTLYGHTSTVRCMHLHGNRVVSGSRDSTLRLWDIGTGMCQHVLLGHVAAVRCVQYGPDGRLVVSGAYDYTVKVWNPEREECLHTLQGHTNRVYSLQFDGVHVVSGSLDTSIRVWDVESGACRHTLMGHQSLTSGMELKNNILVSGNADSTVKVWDIMTGQCLQTLSGPNKHNSAVTCLQFNSKFVITSSDDGTVKLWDLKTGEFVRNLVALDSGGSGGVVWRIRASKTKLVCAVGSRNGTEETKLLVLDFDALAELHKIDIK